MKVKIALNREGVRELLLSDEVLKCVEDEAEVVRAKCGSGYGTNSHKGRNRVNVSIQAETAEAQRDNYKNNTLLKAVSGK